jgi:hypothetical protein
MYKFYLLSHYRESKNVSLLKSTQTLKIMLLIDKTSIFKILNFLEHDENSQLFY